MRRIRRLPQCSESNRSQLIYLVDAHPSIEHVIFIPGVLLVGITIGFIFGARSVRAEMAKMKERAKR